jgi:hypothetical protein
LHHWILSWYCFFIYYLLFFLLKHFLEQQNIGEEVVEKEGSQDSKLQKSTPFSDIFKQLYFASEGLHDGKVHSPLLFF